MYAADGLGQEDNARQRLSANDPARIVTYPETVLKPFDSSSGLRMLLEEEYVSVSVELATLIRLGTGPRRCLLAGLKGDAFTHDCDRRILPVISCALSYTLILHKEQSFYENMCLSLPRHHCTNSIDDSTQSNCWQIEMGKWSTIGIPNLGTSRFLYPCTWLASPQEEAATWDE